MSDQIELPCAYSKLSQSKRVKVRNQYIIQQKGMCMFCEEPLSHNPPKRITSMPILWSAFPAGFLKHQIHLQHCHKTDMTEGAVHAYCNAVLWQYHNR